MLQRILGARLFLPADRGRADVFLTLDAGRWTLDAGSRERACGRGILLAGWACRGIIGSLAVLGVDGMERLSWRKSAINARKMDRGSWHDALADVRTDRVFAHNHDLSGVRESVADKRLLPAAS